MKVYIDSFGNIKKVLDNVFVANSTTYDNVMTWYFVDDNGDVVTNEEVSYCSVSMMRSDGHLISRINCPLTLTDEGYGYQYTCTQYDGILMVAGALQITAQFVKATIEDEEITDREILCTTVVEGHVKINYGIAGEEYFNDVLEQAMLDRDTLQAEITALALQKVDYNEMTDKPIVNQDLSAVGFTPVANTYYRNTGDNEYAKGGIYFYNGTRISKVITYGEMDTNLAKKQDINILDLGTYEATDLESPNYIEITESVYNEVKSGKYQIVKVTYSNLSMTKFYKILDIYNGDIRFQDMTYAVANEPNTGDLTVHHSFLIITENTSAFRYEAYTYEETDAITDKQTKLTTSSVSTVSGNNSLDTVIGFRSNGLLNKGTLKTINNEALATRLGGNLDLVPQRLNTLPNMDTTSSRMSVLLYVDNNGTSSKVSMKDMFGMFIRQGATQPSDMQPGEYLFLEKGED